MTDNKWMWLLTTIALGVLTYVTYDRIMTDGILLDAATPRLAAFATALALTVGAGTRTAGLFCRRHSEY